MNSYIPYFFNTILYYIFVAYHRTVYFFSNIFIKKIEYISQEKLYYSPVLEKFQKFILNNGENKNTNIDPIFYDKKEFNEFMKTDKNSLESIWKTRIRIDFSPRGNIIMFYDAYKMGFSYYCDQNVVSYDILNAIAMKYVMTYNCYSFFIDEFIISEENPLKKHYLEDKKEDNTQKTKQNNSFVKLKNCTSEKKQDKETDVMKNKFIYLGNIRNFQINQSIIKKRTNLFQNKCTLLDGLDQSISYKEFKLLKNKQYSSSTE